MRFLASILIFLSCGLFIAMPYAMGHGLATHNNRAIILGLILGAVGSALFFVQKRLFREPAH
jgi:hypothetical protein